MSSPTIVFILANDQRECFVAYTKFLDITLDVARTTGLYSRQLEANMTKLVYVEVVSTVLLAVDRMNVIESMGQAHRESLIEKQNPDWKDLSQVKVPVVAGERSSPDHDALAHHITTYIDDRIRRLKAEYPDAFNDDLGPGGVPAVLPVTPRSPVLSGAEAKEIPCSPPIDD